jgi:exonuclease VII small subunit
VAENLLPALRGGGREAAGGAVQPSNDESVDTVLDRLDAVIARLAEAREPIEDLVVAYEEGARLLAEAGRRLALLAREAGVPA